MSPRILKVRIGEVKKVILYGIRGAGRKEIELYLSNSYEIVGYSDSDKQYHDFHYVDYINFFRPEELADLEFDYIIITPKYLGTSNEIKKKILARGGVKEEKILQYALFHAVEYPHPTGRIGRGNRTGTGGTGCV